MLDADPDAPVLSAPDPDTLADAEHFAAEIAALRDDGDPERFRRFRLVHGVYGIRNRDDRFMVRIKIPFGILARRQWSALADVADVCADRRAHLTTRQCVQFHHVPLDCIPEVIRRVGEVGLTTREAAGNGVRNITSCPLAGICPHEVFDVRPLAAALVRHLLRNPLAQDLPRKFKISFSGCARDCALARIHDLGFVATVDTNGQPGFRLWAAGGLGAVPQQAVPLSPFVPLHQVTAVADATIAAFAQHGDRRNRARARLKFVAARLGGEGLRQTVAEQGQLLGLTLPALGTFDPAAQPPSWPTPVTPPPAASDRGLALWMTTNTVAQKQPGFAAVWIAPPGGNLAAVEMQALARLASDFGDGRLRLALSQDVILPWIRTMDLPQLHQRLTGIGLGAPGALRPANVTGCPGSATCNLAITASNTLARELRRVLLERPEYGLADDLADLRIRVSGCPNSCGHHQVGGIGLQGGSARVDGREMPVYRILLGGGAEAEDARFGTAVAQVPARHVPEAVLRILEVYRQDRAADEGFVRWARRRAAERAPVAQMEKGE